MREKLRNSGIDIVGDLSWGSHFCQFYETKADLLDILVSYFKAGLENSEFCMWIVSQPSEVEEAKEILRKAVPDFEIYLDKGQIEIINYSQAYVNEETSDSEIMLKSWIGKLNQALNNGYEGLRLTNSTFPLGKKDWNSFTDYGEKLDSSIGNYQIIALCTYFLDKYSTTEIIDVVLNHQFALIKREGKWERIESSRRKKAEEKIRNLANVVESSGDAIITKSLDGIITSWNKSAEQIYGYSAEEIMGKPVSILEPSILVEETKELAEMVKQGDRIHHYETLRLRKNGKLINVSLTLSPVFDVRGELTAISIIARDITRSKKVEEKLKENEKRYRLVTEQTGQAVYEYDLRNNKSTWAGAVEEVTGYTFKELQKLGRDFWIRNIYYSAINKADEKSQNIRTLKGRFKEELRLKKKDGTCVYIENRGVCLLDHEGQAYGAMGILEDITSAKLADLQLQENEERYRIATEQTGQVIFDFNFETDRVSLAGAVREVTGYNSEELENLDKSVLIEFVHPEDRIELLSALRKSFEAKRKFQVEFRFRKKDGTYIYAENSGVWLKDDRKEIYRAIGVIKNITVWKLAIKKVEESERKYASFIKNFHGIAFQLDENFVPEFLNGAVAEVTGYSEEEFMSQIKWKDIILPEDLAFVLKEEKKIQNSPSLGYEEIEFHIRHRDGRIKWVNEIIQKIQSKGGKPFYQGTIYDVTEKKETEKFLTNIEAARKKEIHHRIKNNLQVISSLLDLQGERFKDRKTVQTSEVIEAFLESQSRVISMALIHEELYKGGGFDTLNFSSYIEELIGNLFHTYKLGNTNTRLDTDLEKNIFFDMDIAVPLGIIVNELVSNSLKYAFIDRNDGRIQIKLYREVPPQNKENKSENDSEDLKGINYILKVSDNEIGIPESIDLKNPKSLGLQLVTTLVEQLEGELELKRNNGTEFIVKFTVI